MRFITPALFAAAALYVGWYNGQHGGGVLVLPGLEVVSPGLKGNMAGQGALTVQVFFGLAAIFTVWELIRYIRAKAAPSDQ